MRCSILRLPAETDVCSPPFSYEFHRNPRASRLDVHKNGAPLINHVPGGIDVCAALDEETNYAVVPARARDMEGENTVDDGVHGLSVIEGICDKAEVPRGGGGVEAKVGDCIAGGSGTYGRRKKGASTHNLG